MNGVVAGYEIEVVAPGECGQVTSPRLDPRPLMPVGKLLMLTYWFASKQPAGAMLLKTLGLPFCGPVVRLLLYMRYISTLCTHIAVDLKWVQICWLFARTARLG